MYLFFRRIIGKQPGQIRGWPFPTQPLKTDDLHQNFTQLQLLHRGHPGCMPGRDWFARMMEELGYFIDIEYIYASDPGAQADPHTVILYGEAGMGKSRLVRQVREAWREGQLFRDRFQHVFYISCTELDRFASLSLSEFITKYSVATLTPIKKILSQPEQLLFILDGLNESWFQWRRNTDLCLHWNQKTEVYKLLGSLMDKVILPEASLLITARTTIVKNDLPCLEKGQFVEVLGFSESGRKDYFCKYFTDESQTSRALSVVESNPALWTLCLVPWVSWLVCTCLKQQMERGQELSLKCQTTTALCLQFLSQNLPGQPYEAQLRGLCSLAAECTLQGRTRFTQLEFIKHEIHDAIISTFIKISVIKKHPIFLYYYFTHLYFQEFFAAMCWILEDNDTSSIFDTSRDNITLQENHWKRDVFVAPTTRFLFGLSSQWSMKELESIFKCKLSQEKKWELLTWIQDEIWHEQLSWKSYSLRLLHCLYEIQDEDFVSKAVCHFQETSMFFQTDMDFLVFTFFIRFCKHINSLKLRISKPYRQTGKPSNMLVCNLTPVTDLSWKILFSTLGVMGNLKYLDLSGNFLNDSAMQSLCEALRFPQCHLDILWLDKIFLDDKITGMLRALEEEKPQLHILDISLIQRQGWTVKRQTDSFLSEPYTQWGKDVFLSNIHKFRQLAELLRCLGDDIPSKSLGNELSVSRKRHVKQPNKDHEAGEMSDHTSSAGQQRPESEEISPKMAKMESLCLSSPAPVRYLHMDLELDAHTFWGPLGPVAIELVDKERSHYRVHFPMTGFYHWHNTGLRFVLRRSATIEIEFCDWKQFLDRIVPQQSWMVAGPLFDIKADPGAVVAVYLPHFVAYDHGESVNSSQFHVAHFKKEGMVLEKPASVEASYTVLENPNFSPMGVLVKILPVTRKFIPITTTVLLYHHLYPEDVNFHLYLIPNDCTIRKAIDDEESKFQFMRIHKPPPRSPLYLGSCFTVSGSIKMEINPQELELCYRSPRDSQLFSDISVGHLDSGIKLQLKDKKSKRLIWEALVKPGELTPTATGNPSGPTDAQISLHFVDQNREELVTRVTSVDPILDKLLGKVLSHEQYEMVRSEATTQGQMRRLFSFSRSWSRACKDCLYKALKEIHPHLILEIWEKMGASSVEA